MNARDIIKLAAKLYVDDYLEKKTTILANAEKGKDINIDIFMPKVTEVTISDFAKYLQKAIETQPKEERAKHRKFFGEPISFCRCVARGNIMASVSVEEFNSEVKKNKRKLRGIKKMFEALGILVDLNKKRLATCKKCGKTNKECFPTTIEEYDMYIEMLCENCLTEILDKKITAIKPKKNRITRKET